MPLSTPSGSGWQRKSPAEACGLGDTIQRIHWRMCGSLNEMHAECFRLAWHREAGVVKRDGRPRRKIAHQDISRQLIRGGDLWPCTQSSRFVLLAVVVSSISCVWAGVVTARIDPGMRAVYNAVA